MVATHTKIYYEHIMNYDEMQKKMQSIKVPAIFHESLSSFVIARPPKYDEIWLILNPDPRNWRNTYDHKAGDADRLGYERQYFEPRSPEDHHRKSSCVISYGNKFIEAIKEHCPEFSQTLIDYNSGLHADKANIDTKKIEQEIGMQFLKKIFAEKASVTDLDIVSYSTLDKDSYFIGFGGKSAVLTSPKNAQALGLKIVEHYSEKQPGDGWAQTVQSQKEDPDRGRE